MKKLLASTLSMVLLLSVLTVPVAAKEGYTYKPFTITGINGTTYSFSAACTGYGISCDYQRSANSDAVDFDAAVILKEGSTVSLTEGYTEDNGFICMDIQIRNVVGDFMSVDCRSYYGSTVAVEELYRSSCSWLEYEMEDALGYIITPQKQRVVILLENTAEAHRDMISYPGPAIDNTPAKPEETTRYQSTAELTDATVAELDYNDFTLTVTNPTDSQDSGTVALVLASKMATVHFVDYDLGPKESKEYHVIVSGHIGVGYDQFMVLLGKGWGAYLNADIITFESDADRDAYRAAVVYEENMNGTVSQGSASGANAHVVICNGQPGDNWLKQYTGIGRHDKPYLDPALSHDICK